MSCCCCSIEQNYFVSVSKSLKSPSFPSGSFLCPFGGGAAANNPARTERSKSSGRKSDSQSEERQADKNTDLTSVSSFHHGYIRCLQVGGSGPQVTSEMHSKYCCVEENRCRGREREMGGAGEECLTLCASSQHTDELVSERTGEQHRCPVERNEREEKKG